MPQFHIVTDSGAQIGNLLAAHGLPVTILNNQITTAEGTYPEGRQNGDPTWKQPPSVEPPRVEAYAEAFATLARTYDGILCIVPSRHIFDHWSRAQAAISQIGGAPPVRIVDSQMLAAGQALLTLEAVRVLENVTTLDDAERNLRGTITRAYLMLYVDRVELLARYNILNPQHTLFSAMLGVKPLLTIEGGILKPVEKARSRSNAIERLFEFAAEFGDVAQIAIMHDQQSHDMASRLRQRLASEVEGQIETMVYNPSLAALVGIGGLGIAILERSCD